jgi:endonuclease/exonuclease/phosphatase family metal-dependent hydrolase
LLGLQLGRRPALFSQAQSSAFTTISYNVLACLGYRRTADNKARLEAAQSQMERRVTSELLLYDPDVITFSESVTEAAAHRIARHLGMNVAWFPPGVRSYPGYPIGFPGTVFTKHRILAVENAPYAGQDRDPSLFTRHWGRAIIDTGPERITLFSGHLHPNNALTREREITIMLGVIERDVAAGGSVLFHGDLNDPPKSKDYARWLGTGLQDAFATGGTGDPNTFNSVQPKTRIDYIWTAGPLSKRLREARVLNEGAFRTNPSDPQSFALSDHLPVMATFHRADAAQ